MAVKSVSIRIEQDMLDKIAYIADYEGRSVNSQILVLIRENIKTFEDANGTIDGNITPASNPLGGKNLSALTGVTRDS